jgi:hypothetical protein
MGNVITTTLSSGQPLTVDYSANFGEVIITGLLLALAAVLVLEFTFQVIHR